MGSFAISSVAQAAVDPNGHLTYSLNAGTYLANADGSSPRLLSYDIQGTPAWSPDGSKLAYQTSQATFLAKPDLSGSRQLNHRGGGASMAWSPGGAFLVYPNGSQLWYLNADSDAVSEDGYVGEGVYRAGLNPDPAHISDSHPSFARNGTLAFERSGGSAGSGIYTVAQGSVTAVLRVPGGRSPVFSPDGSRIAYVVPDDDLTKVQVWVANADGSDAAVLTTDEAGADEPVWSPDGTSILYRTSWAWSFSYDVKKIDVASREVTTVVPHTDGNGGRDISWQRNGTNYVDRVFGGNAIETGIAASQYDYETRGVDDPLRVPANTVVLSRSDAFYDALAGSALAINKGGPLLTTPPTALDAKVQAEITRVLGNSGTVYVLGSFDAISKAVSDKLTGLGYTVKRLAGGNMFETNVLINREITAKPAAVIIATGQEFYDALSAGAAAGANQNIVVVLTWGATMPAASASYLNALNPYPPSGGAYIYTAGGAGENALLNGYFDGQMPNWGSDPTRVWYYPHTGRDAVDTSVLLARTFFTGPQQAALATNASWYDALTGGAMVGASYGPLLLNPKSTLDSRVAAYLSDNSNSITIAQLMGSNNSLADSLVTPIGNAIGLPGNSVYTEYRAVASNAASGRALTAQGSHPRTDGPLVKPVGPQVMTGKGQPIGKG